VLGMSAKPLRLRRYDVRRLSAGTTDRLGDFSPPGGSSSTNLSQRIACYRTGHVKVVPLINFFQRRNQRFNLGLGCLQLRLKLVTFFSVVIHIADAQIAIVRYYF
jgi:hypothetical protein